MFRGWIAAGAGATGRRTDTPPASENRKPSRDALQGLLLDEVATKQYFDGCLSEAGPVWSR